MTIKFKFQEKLDLLDEYISYLKKLKKDVNNNKKRFLDDFYLFGIAERYFQLSIQIIIDTTQMIIIEEGLKKPEDNQEAFSLL